jgi:hypothetical protein
VWCYGPEWYWHGWRTLLPVQLGGDEYGRRTLMAGWTVTGRVVVAISRPGRLYPPDALEVEDPHTGDVLRASIYPYGGGVKRHGVQLSVFWQGNPDEPVAVLRLPAEDTRSLAGLIGASRSLVWHDPRDADDEFWNPQEGS